MRKQTRRTRILDLRPTWRLLAILTVVAVGGGALVAHGPIVLPIATTQGGPEILAIVGQRPHLSFSNPSLDFGAVASQSARALLLDVGNTTSRPLAITVVPPPGIEVAPDSLALGGHETASITVTWRPPTAGDLVGDLAFAVTHAGAGGPLVETLPVRGQATDPNAAPSVTWQDFVDARQAGTEPILPDFSYAGYGHTQVPIPDRDGPLFEVTAFGAVANDGASDRDAIQAAIDAAAAAGGGVVRFPIGTFHLNTAGRAEDPIRIEHSHIVLRGAGMDGSPTGTTLVMARHLPLEDPQQLASAPFMIQVRPAGAPASVELTTVVADARRETFAVTVDTAAGLQVGQWVTLSFVNARDEVFDFYLAPQQRPVCDPQKPDRCWTRGLQIKERHRIAAIDGDRVTFDDPIHIDIDLGILQPGEHWRLLTYPHIAEVGIEDLLFQGGWTLPFVHHTAVGDCSQEECISHDSAWSAVLFDSVVDGWVRRTRFRDWNQSLTLFDSSRCSLLGLAFDGNKGHFSVHTRGGTGNLIGLSRELASHHHGPSVGYGSAATVFWRFAYPGDSSFDAHSTSPYATLYDRTAGGVRYGRAGGPHKGMPNHLRHLVLWNFEHRGSAVWRFDFWTPSPRTYFVRPIVVGFHRDPTSGSDVSFATEDLEIDELHGQLADPPSLFEAQLALRTGQLPAWLVALRDDG